MKFDSLLAKIGEFGPYQKRLYFLVCLPAIPVGLQIMIEMVFLLAVPKHRCAIPGLTNDTYAVQGELHERLINISIPFDEDKSEYSQCQVYSNVFNNYTDCSTDNSTTSGQSLGSGCSILYNDVFNSSVTTANRTTEKCHRWVFDKSVYGSTVSTDLNMVCDKQLYVVHAKMVVMLSMFLGSVLSGPISDIVGRKTVLMGGITGNIVGSVCMAWATSYPVFLVLIFMVCGASQAAYISGFVYGTELVGPSKRRFTGIIMNMFWSIGNLLVAGIVYVMREWKYRQLIFAAPAVVFWSYFWLLPESPRWLLMRNRKKEAEKILFKMAKSNNVEFKPELLKEVIAHDTEDVQPFWKLFQSKIMIFRCLIIFFNWLTIGMGFYGMSLNIVNLSGNVYANYFIFNVFEFVAYILCLLVVDKLGRKRLHCYSMLTSGIACSLTIIPRLVSNGNHQWIITTLATIGNTGACAAYATIYLYSLELLPTVARNSGMGLGSMFAKLGSIASPYIADLGLIIGGQFGDSLPLLIFGSVLVAAGLLSLALPETFSKELPETIRDGEMMGNSDHRFQDTIKESELHHLNGTASSTAA